MEEQNYQNAIVTKGERGQIYIYVKPQLRDVPGCVKKTVEIKDHVYLDLDEKGEVIGVEIL